MAFLTEPEPPRLVATEIAAGIRRMVAPNPGPMTYHGTNSWLLQEPDGLTVIDPGPDNAAHVRALAQSGPIARILLTHSHPDHLAGAPALQAATGAPIHAWGTPAGGGFRPDVGLADGDRVGRLTALHTPGHASDHLCFALDEAGIVFTGDHVMSWSTSIVSPPDGDMGAYMASLRRLLERSDSMYLCGHGPKLPAPLGLVRAMLAHRAGREASIVAALRTQPLRLEALVAQLYAGLEPHLLPAATRTALAHLRKLHDEGRAIEAASGWQLTAPGSVRVDGPIRG
jgi:glyoxylase-like metal-dependent hydrolase (beta-lactamase superfamily II)